jgi:hypothetical protein
MLLPITESGLSPELAGDLNGVDAGRLPPGLLVAGAMDRAVMRAAERDGELVARFAAECPRLQVAKMMRIGLFAAADETRLLGDITKVLAVTIAPRCRKDEPALVDAVGLIEVAASFRERRVGANNIGMSAWSSAVGGFRGCGRCEPVFKSVLHKLGIGCREAVLDGQRLLRPNRGEISRGDGPKLGQQLFAQRGRLLRLKGGRPLGMHAIATLSIAGLSRRHPRLAVLRHERVLVG